MLYVSPTQERDIGIIIIIIVVYVNEAHGYYTNIAE